MYGEWGGSVSKKRGLGKSKTMITPYAWESGWFGLEIWWVDDAAHK